MGEILKRLKERLPVILFILGALTLLVLGLLLISCIVQIIGLKSDLQSLKDDVQLLQSNPPSPRSTVKNTGGNTYYRWGRRVCGSDSTLIYEGFAAGGHYYYNGSAVNTLCLPRDPDLKDPTVRESVTRIYGTEYENQPIKNHDVPCAVCNTKQRTNVLMIPAKQTCPDAWTLEYKGMLMAGHYTQFAGSEYICVDEKPEVGGKNTNQNGKLLYNVGVACGSLPCKYYQTGKLVTCVICSQ